MAISEKQSFILRRMRVESFIEDAVKLEKQAKRNRQSMEAELNRIQNECPHENVKVENSWQGGGLYFDNAHCLDCNKKKSRYNRKLTLEKNKEWYKRTDEENEKLTPLRSNTNFGEYDW